MTASRGDAELGAVMIMQSFVEPAFAVCAAQFPRCCSTCNRDFTSFSDFIANTKQVGAPMLDAIEDEAPLGLMVFYNCVCGTTLGISCEDVSQHSRFNAAVRKLTAAGEPLQQVLQSFVDHVKTLATRVSVARTPAVAQPDALLLEVGAAMISLIEARRIAVPPRPSAALSLVELARSQDTSVAKVVAELESDPALAATVLLRANSALYGSGRAVTTLPAAVARLGMQEIARLALAASLGAAATSDGPLWPVRAALWHRTLLRAYACRHLATARGASGDEAFVAGLLHGFGALMGALALEAVTPSRRVPFAPQPLNWWLRVLEHFRAELGALAAREWKLVAVLEEVIALHPGADRTASANRDLLDVVTSGNAIARIVEVRHEVSAADLEHCGLRQGEAMNLARAIPGWAPALAVMESGSSRTPKDALVAAAQLETRPLATPVELRHLETGAVFRVVPAAGSIVLLEGKASIPREALTAFALADDSEAVLWGIPRRYAPLQSQALTELHLFPQAAAIALRWRLALEP